MMSNNTEEMKAPSLSEFVSAAILEIAAGLNDAQDKGRELGVKIYPNSYEDTSEQMDIEFDLSVSSETEGKTDGGVKINIPVLGVSYGKDSTGKTGTARGKSNVNGRKNPITAKAVKYYAGRFKPSGRGIIEDHTEMGEWRKKPAS